jgi:branched-chain amino acid transport system substrate-binding protein
MFVFRKKEEDVMAYGKLLTVLGLFWASLAAAEAEPLKVALVEALSGVTAGGGKVYQDATTLSIERLNAAGGFNGEPIQLMAFDNGGNVSQTTDKVREAIEKGAHVIVQAGASSIAGQISEDVRKYNLRNPSKPVIYLNLGAEASELTGAKCNFYSFRLAPTASMRIEALLDVLKKKGQLGTRVYSVNQNYSYGQDAEAAIVGGTSKFGYEVVGKVLHDFGRVPDFAPYAARIKETNPDSVLTGDWFTDLILLMKASRESGLRAVFGTTYLDYPGVIGSLGDLSVGNFVATTSNAEYADPQLVKTFKDRTGRNPTFGGDLHFMNMFDLLGGALSKLSVKGGAVDVRKIALALEMASTTTSLGKTSIRKEDHQAILPIVISVAKKGAKFPAEGSDVGFEPASIVAGEQVLYPVQSACKMDRPG